MTVLNIQVGFQQGNDGLGGLLGALFYVANGVFGTPQTLYTYVYGGSDNSSATPYPVFVSDASARTYFDGVVGPAFITAANGYVLPTYYTSYAVQSGDIMQVNSSWVETNTSAPDFIVGKPSLAAVATSGAYNDLSGKPTLATVAMSGSYSDLSGKPSLATVATTGVYSDLTGKPSLATVATTGSYSDLTGKPTVPTVQAYEGTAQRLNAFPIFKDATVASGVAVFNLTNDGTSGGTALFPNGVIQDSVNLFVSDSTASYQMAAVWSNSNKTLTVTTNKLTTANILTGILGQAAANGSVVKLQVWVY